MDKGYYIAEIEKNLERIRAGVSNLNDADNNFAALASELRLTAEWVEAHAPMKWAHQPKVKRGKVNETGED